MLSWIASFFTGGKRPAQADDDEDEQRANKRQCIGLEINHHLGVDQDAWDEACKEFKYDPADEEEWNDVEYDPLKLSKKDAKALEKLGVISLNRIMEQQRAAADQEEELESYIDKIYESMTTIQLEKELKKRKAKAGGTEMELKERLEALVKEEHEAPDYLTNGVLLELQESWNHEPSIEGGPTVKHIFSRPIALLSEPAGRGTPTVAIPQDAALANNGAWLKSRGTKQDIKMLDAFMAEIQGRDTPGHASDRFYLKLRASEADYNIQAVLAPPTTTWGKVTKESFAGMDEDEQRFFLWEALGVGNALCYYLTPSHEALQVRDFKAEEAVPEDWQTRWPEAGDLQEAQNAMQEEWVERKDKVQEPLEPLIYMVPGNDAMPTNPYFALGVTKNGNIAGYVGVLVWT